MELFKKELINKIGKTLIKKTESIAIAESVTAGYMQAAIASADNAIQFFQGGITAYNIGQKARHLHVDPIRAAACNCVSKETAVEMAINVCTLFKSNWGIGITGYASPVPESKDHVFCYYAIVCSDKIVKSGKINGKGKDAFEAQITYVSGVIETLAGIVSRHY